MTTCVNKTAFKTFDLFIFDFDGVIIDSIPLMQDAFEAVREQYWFDHQFSDFINCQGLSLDEIILKLGLPAEFKNCYLEYSIENMSRVTLFPHVVQILDFLRSKSKIVVLYTGKDLFRTQIIMDNYEIRNYFDFVLTGCTEIKGKPSAEGINLLVHLFREKKSKTIMIGDSINDFLSAKKAGVHCAGINVHKDMSNEIQPDINLDNLSDIIKRWG